MFMISSIHFWRSSIILFRFLFCYNKTSSYTSAVMFCALELLCCSRILNVFVFNFIFLVASIGARINLLFGIFCFKILSFFSPNFFYRIHLSVFYWYCLMGPLHFPACHFSLSVFCILFFLLRKSVPKRL
mgnify:CR=1 FL=1